MDPTLYYDVAQELLDCVCEALDENTECLCPCRSFITFGEVAWDSCCPDGQLWVALDRVYPFYADFPELAADGVNCTVQLAADFSVGILRCVPTLSEDGSPPSPSALTASTLQILTDAAVVQRALICCLSAQKKYRKFTAPVQTYLGPEGGCGGSITRFTMEMTRPSRPGGVS